MSDETEPPEGTFAHDGNRRYRETSKVPKRHYTMSDAALAARRANAQKSTGPVTAEGKEASSHNSWKHGLYAGVTALGLIGKPCFTTCPKYPCSLVEDNETHPGAACLDKEFFLDSLQKIQAAVREKQFDGVNEIFGLTLAKTLSIVNDLMDRIHADGGVVANVKTDKDGNVIGYDHVLHPAIIALPKLLASLGISFDSTLLTPASIAKNAKDADAEKIDSAVSLMAQALANVTGAKKNNE